LRNLNFHALLSQKSASVEIFHNTAGGKQPVNLFSIEEAGDKGAGRPFPLHPKSPAKLLRFAPDTFRNYAFGMDCVFCAHRF
jgi:hypothetical protein